MGFFDIYGTPRKVSSAKGMATTRSMLEEGISNQRRILNGEKLTNQKGDPIRSWFNKSKFTPMIGIYSLFDGKSVEVKQGSEKQQLDDFEKYMKEGEFDRYIDAVDKKRTTSKNK